MPERIRTFSVVAVSAEGDAGERMKPWWKDKTLLKLYKRMTKEGLN